MSNITAIPFDFSVTNFAGSTALTGYSLNICPFTFTFNNSAFAFLSDTRILWSFGDGTTSTALTAQHSYSMPGNYAATLFMYNSANEVYSSNAQTLSVFNYIADNIVLSASSTQLTASTVANPLIITRYNTWQNQPSQPVIQLRVDESASAFVDAASYLQDADLHLKTSSRFLLPVTLPTNVIDFECIDSVLTTDEKIYVKLSGSNIVNCLSSDANSTFAGSSGTATIYYVDDLPGHPVVSVKFDTSKFVDLQTAQLSSKLYPQYSVLQMAADTMYYTVSTNVAQKLTFSSNGIDYIASPFAVNANNYVGAKIPFVVRATNSNNDAVKNGYKLSQVDAISSIANNTVFVTVMSGATALTECIIRSDFEDLQFYPRGGFFRGYVTIPFEATNLYLSAYGNMTTSQGVSAIVQGVSNAFSVYSSAGAFVANKFNEDFDYLTTIKGYRFQESLQNTDDFFDTVLGPILGDANSPNNALGKRIYEKTANFVNNNVNVDECGIAALDSMYQMTGESLQQFESLRFAAPADLRAQMDLCSIKHSKLWGARNAFKQDFDTLGYVDSQDYGRNLGTKLNFTTARLSAAGTGDNAYIVAYEKFSSKYILCNTNIPAYLQNNAYVPNTYNATLSTYALSSVKTYLEQWGWPLVLPQDRTNINVEDYYIFYSYKTTPQNAQLEGVIDWSNNNNTLSETQSSYTTWTANGGIVDNMLQYKLAAGLQLFNDESVNALPGYSTLGFFYLDDNKSTLLLQALSADLSIGGRDVWYYANEWTVYLTPTETSDTIVYTNINATSLAIDTIVYTNLQLTLPYTIDNSNGYSYFFLNNLFYSVDTNTGAITGISNAPGYFLINTDLAGSNTYVFTTSSVSAIDTGVQLFSDPYLSMPVNEITFIDDTNFYSTDVDGIVSSPDTIPSASSAYSDCTQWAYYPGNTFTLYTNSTFAFYDENLQYPYANNTFVNAGGTEYTTDGRGQISFSGFCSPP